MTGENKTMQSSMKDVYIRPRYLSLVFRDIYNLYVPKFNLNFMRNSFRYKCDFERTLLLLDVNVAK